MPLNSNSPTFQQSFLALTLSPLVGSYVRNSESTFHFYDLAVKVYDLSVRSSNKSSSKVDEHGLIHHITSHLRITLSLLFQWKTRVSFIHVS